MPKTTTAPAAPKPAHTPVPPHGPDYHPPLSFSAAAVTEATPPPPSHAPHTVAAPAAGGTLAMAGGAQRIVAGTGMDTLTGGHGHDVFVFGQGTTGVGAGHRDVVTDFAAHDRMDFSGFAGAGRELSVTVLHEKGFDVVQLLVNGHVEAEVQASGHYKWGADDFILH